MLVTMGQAWDGKNSIFSRHPMVDADSLLFLGTLTKYSYPPQKMARRCIAYISKKTEKGILTQQSIILEPSVLMGTTFILKKGVGSKPIIDFIKLKAEIVSKCQYMQDLNVKFQRQSIKLNKKPILFHEERDGDICLQLGRGDEGIYGGDIKIGQIPPSYTRFLPDPLKKMLEEKQIKLRLFVPHTEQIMNRNQLMKEEEFADKARVLIFTALFHFYLKELTPAGTTENNDLLKILSQDYWDKFNHDFKPHKQLFLMIQAIEQKKWELLTIQPNREIRMKILHSASRFFSHVSEGSNLALSTPDNTQNAGSYLYSIFEKDVMKSKKEAMENLSAKLSDPSLFAQLLTNTPLSPLDPSSTFMDVRNEWIYVLVNENFLLMDGDYNTDFIKNCSEQDLKNRINRCKEIVWQLVSEKDREYSKKIINKFAESILSCCMGFKKQGELANLEIALPPEAEDLTQFCKQIAKRFGREIEVSFYSKTDGTNACIYRGFDILFANQLGLLKNFLDIYTHATPMEETETLGEQQMKSILDVLETITHELVHLNEQTDCESTHDAVFRNQLANFFESLFIRTAAPEQSVLKLLGI